MDCVEVVDEVILVVVPVTELAERELEVIELLITIPIALILLLIKEPRCDIDRSRTIPLPGYPSTLPDLQAVLNSSHFAPKILHLV